jgi:hypothetical protein
VSWYQLLLIDMQRGRYLRLGQRPVEEYNWMTLWMLVQDMEQARVSE